MADFSKNISEKKKVGSGLPFTLMTVAGRWLVVYTSNGINDQDTMMYFVDFRIELDDSTVSNLLSDRVLANLKVLQTRYDGVYEDRFDTFEVSNGSSQEQVLKQNLVTCDSDTLVLEKARALGALPMIQTLTGEDKLKVTLVDEKIQDGDRQIINAYALIHFGKTETENSGFAYLKLYDLLNNYERIDDFLLALEKLGGKFTRSVIMDRFRPEQWN